MASNSEFRDSSLIEKQIELLDEFLVKFKSEILLVGLTHKQTDMVLKLMNDLLTENENAIEHLLIQTTTEPQKIVQNALGHCKKSLSAIDSQYKR